MIDPALRFMYETTKLAEEQQEEKKYPARETLRRLSTAQILEGTPVRKFRAAMQILPAAALVGSALALPRGKPYELARKHPNVGAALVLSPLIAPAITDTAAAFRSLKNLDKIEGLDDKEKKKLRRALYASLLTPAASLGLTGVGASKLLRGFKNDPSGTKKLLVGAATLAAHRLPNILEAVLSRKPSLSHDTVEKLKEQMGISAPIYSHPHWISSVAHTPKVENPRLKSLARASLALGLIPKELRAKAVETGGVFLPTDED